MIARVHQSMAKKDKGFTLVELLVVVVIIGILAAIAIPAFLRQRESAWRAAVESDLKNASLAIENGSIQNDGLYAFANGWTQTSTGLSDNGYNNSDNVTLTVTSTDTEYEIVGGHTSLTNAPTVATFDSTTGTIAWTP